MDSITVSFNDGAGDNWCPRRFEAVFESGVIFSHDFGGRQKHYGDTTVKRRSEFCCDIS